MKAFATLAAVLALGASFAAPAIAQHHDHGPYQAHASGPMSEGTVQKVDKAAKKVTIKHGDLKNLGMGPMTMAFQLLDQTQFDRLKIGDKVSFVAEMVDGKLTVTMIEVAR
jgi:Cu(I)/Ag(I) efflux system periplasmic protein CusF